MRASRSIANGVLLLLLAAPAAARDLWTRKWIEVRTQHFSVASAIDEEDTLRLATDLESFRIAVRRLLNARVEERVPTRVFIVPPRTKELDVGSGQLGWFRPEMRRNVAVVSKGPRGLSLSIVLFHEYSHFLAYNQSSVSYPPWFHEGFAEVLSTMTFDRGHAFVGDLVRNRREWLQYNPWMSYARVLRVRDLSKLSDADQAMFYAQSWALVHYLMLGPHRANFSERMTRYMEGVESGERDGAAFSAAFGEAPEALAARILRYLQGEAKIWPIPLPAEAAAAPPVVRPLAEDEIAARLGIVALVSGNAKLAQKALDAALEANPNNAVALVGSADLHKFAGRFAQAEPLYERAIALEPNDAYHKLDYGEYFIDRAREASTRDPEGAAAWLVEARRQFARSYKLDPGVPETLAMNGATYLGDSEGAERALASLEAAYQMLPSQPQIKFLLAQAYLQAERKRDAARLIRSLVAWNHAGGSTEAMALLRELERDAVAPAPDEDEAEAEPSAEDGLAAPP